MRSGSSAGAASPLDSRSQGPEVACTGYIYSAHSCLRFRLIKPLGLTKNQSQIDSCMRSRRGTRSPTQVRRTAWHRPPLPPRTTILAPSGGPTSFVAAAGSMLHSGPHQ